VLTVLFARCLWQSRSLLHVLNAPFTQLRTSSAAEGTRGELPKALARSASAFIDVNETLCNPAATTRRRPGNKTKRLSDTNCVRTSPDPGVG
jgi:hypothetical protein